MVKRGSAASLLKESSSDFLLLLEMVRSGRLPQKARPGFRRREFFRAKDCRRRYSVPSLWCEIDCGFRASQRRWIYLLRRGGSSCHLARGDTGRGQGKPARCAKTGAAVPTRAGRKGLVTKRLA